MGKETLITTDINTSRRKSHLTRPLFCQTSGVNWLYAPSCVFTQPSFLYVCAKISAATYFHFRLIDKQHRSGQVADIPLPYLRHSCFVFENVAGSNTGLNTSYLDWDGSWFFSVPPGRFLNSASNYAMTASIYILSEFIAHKSSILWATSSFPIVVQSMKETNFRTSFNQTVIL